MLSPRRWIVFFIGVFLLLATLFSLAARYLDPFIQYGYDERKRFWGNSMYLNPGIARNYDYDTVIIGSSMAQNFDMAFFRGEIPSKPVKLVLPGISVNETALFYDLAIRTGKARNIFIVVDLPQFNREYAFGISSDRLPLYLYNDYIYDDFKYLWGYDIWFRFIPVNLAIDFLYRGGAVFPSRLEERLNIDKIGDWSQDYTFSKEAVIQNYKTGRFSTTRESAENMESRMIANIDTFLDHVFAAKRDCRIVFAFPPYSALYWYNVEREGFFDNYMNAKGYFIERCQGTNVRVVDLQAIDEIADLDHYKDSTHYDTFIQAKLAKAIVTGAFDADGDSLKRRQGKLKELIYQFVSDNAGWLTE